MHCAQDLLSMRIIASQGRFVALAKEANASQTRCAPVRTRTFPVSQQIIYIPTFFAHPFVPRSSHRKMPCAILTIDINVSMEMQSFVTITAFFTNMEIECSCSFGSFHWSNAFLPPAFTCFVRAYNPAMVMAAQIGLLRVVSLARHLFVMLQVIPTTIT